MKVDPSIIFRGNSDAPAQDIKNALGWMEQDDQAVPNLVGAVMTLCARVAYLEKKVEQLSAANMESANG